jgi:hypothetical protein
MHEDLTSEQLQGRTAPLRGLEFLAYLEKQRPYEMSPGATLVLPPSQTPLTQSTTALRGSTSSSGSDNTGESVSKKVVKHANHNSGDIAAEPKGNISLEKRWYGEQNRADSPTAGTHAARDSNGRIQERRSAPRRDEYVQEGKVTYVDTNAEKQELAPTNSRG